MASEKAQRILLKRETPFTAEQIFSMSDADAWAWIYENDKEIRQLKAESKAPQVCFTGFTDSQKDELIIIAERTGFEVKDGVTKNLLILVTGSNPGPSKLAKAEQQSCIVTNLDGFFAYLTECERKP